MIHAAADASAREPTGLQVARDLVAGLGAAVFLAWAVGARLDSAVAVTAGATAVYAGAAVLILRLRPAGLPGPGVGLANRVTLARLVLALPVAALALQVAPLTPTARWWIVGLGGLALVLDGVDGQVARRTGTASAFGARFDMETDAALIMVLSGLAWSSGQAPAWVLLMGAMRYLFVGAGVFLPALRGDLFPSQRRKVVCAVQGVVLLVVIAPILSPAPATLLAGMALAALSWSFAVDSWWLLRRHR